MALNIDGVGGELRIGRKRLATIGRWAKRDARVLFSVTDVNAFLAGMGDPPTSILLHMTPRVRRCYPIVSGTLADGAVKVDLMRATSETVPA